MTNHCGVSVRWYRYRRPAAASTRAACILLIVGVYSLLWILEVAGMLPGRWLSTVWLGVAATGVLFLILLVPLYYVARGTDR